MDRDQEMEAALRQRGGSKAKLMVFGAGSLVLLGLLAALLLGSGNSKAQAAFSEFSHCMIGKPLVDGENVFFRLRAVELSQRSHPDASGEEAWPRRCATHANQLYAAIDGNGNTALLKRLMNEQLGCGRGKQPTCNLPAKGPPIPKADELWEAAKLAGLSATVAAGSPDPGQGLRPLADRNAAPLAKGASTSGTRFSERGELLLLMAYRAEENRPDPEGARYRFCTFEASGKRATCADVRLPLAHMSLLDDAGAPAAVGRNDDGDQVAFTLPEGKPVSMRDGVRDGNALERRGDDTFLLEVKAGLASAQLKLAPEFLDVALLPGWLGWEEEDKEQQRKLYFQKIGAGATLSGEPFAIEGDATGMLDSCISGDSGALLARTQNPPRQNVWFLANGRWASQPVSGPLPLSRRKEWSARCSPSRVTRTWMEGTADAPELALLDCRRSGCSKKSVKLPKSSLATRAWVAAVPLAERLALIYETTLEDKRLVLAPFDQLAASEPALLLDSSDFSGPKFEHPMPLVYADKLLIVLFEDAEAGEVRALYVNAAGDHGLVEVSVK